MIDSSLNEKRLNKTISDWGFTLNEKCLIVGPEPPPIGGVSVHITRLSKILKAKNFNFDVYNVSKKLFLGSNFFALFFNIIFKPYQQVHIHSISFQILLSVFLSSFLKDFKIFFTIHNPVSFDQKNYLSFLLLYKILSKASQVNAVSELVRSSILEINPDLRPRVIVKSAFLPPDISLKKEIKDKYPQSLVAFLKKSKPILILNAYKLNFKDGIDVYGLDLAVDLLIRLTKKYPGIRMILALGMETINNEYLNHQIDKLKHYQLDSHLYVLNGFKNIWVLFDDCDIMLRPTLHDGSSISVLEALSMDCKVLASDSVPRPKGCFLFQNRDIDDLERVSLEILNSI